MRRNVLRWLIREVRRLNALEEENGKLERPRRGKVGRTPASAETAGSGRQ